MGKMDTSTRETPSLNFTSVYSFFLLMKPRVMSLVIFTGFSGIYLAPSGSHPLLAFISLLAIAAGAGASGAINQWYDRDIDLIMTRTRERPIPSKQVQPAEALAFGVTVSVLSVLILSLSANLLAGALLAFTIIFYGLIYTVWLKRFTTQNIVIGGAAGAFPPIIGWAAVSGNVSLEAIILFGLIFFWTPPHFWALSLVNIDDYKKANIPMLPVIYGADETRRQIMVYSIIMVFISLLPCLVGMSHIFYGFIAGCSGALFLIFSVQLLKHQDDKRAISLFRYSIMYLFILFLGLICDKAIQENII